MTKEMKENAKNQYIWSMQKLHPNVPKEIVNAVMLATLDAYEAIVEDQGIESKYAKSTEFMLYLKMEKSLEATEELFKEIPMWTGISTKMKEFKECA